MGSALLPLSLGLSHGGPSLVLASGYPSPCFGTEHALLLRFLRGFAGTGGFRHPLRRSPTPPTLSARQSFERHNRFFYMCTLRAQFLKHFDDVHLVSEPTSVPVELP